MSIEKAVCNLIAYGLKESLLEVKIDDWDAVYEEMRHQAVNNIPAIRLKREINNEVISKWYMQCCVDSLRFEQLLTAQKSLLELLHGAGFHPVILKGCAASTYYPDAKMRSYGDIDFLVPKEEFLPAYRLMLASGYHLSYDEDNVDYHYTLDKDGFYFEIHNKPAGLDLIDPMAGEKLLARFQQACLAVETHLVNRYEVPVMPAVENGMVLLLHIVKHVKKGLGLRHLVDWMEFCEHELTDEAYESRFKEVLQNCGLDQLAKCMTRTCQLYLGMKQEGYSWCQCDETICEDLMNYLFEQGNFGKKVKGDQDKGARVLANHGSPIAILKHLQEGGLINWKAAQEHKWLRPFAWIYQIGNNLQRGHAAGGLGYYIRSAKEGKKRKKFFEQLGL